MKRGVLGRLELRVPWKNLSSKPVVAVVEDLYVLCGPQTNVVYNEADERARLLAKKKSDLGQHELLRASRQRRAATRTRTRTRTRAAALWRSWWTRSWTTSR